MGNNDAGEMLAAAQAECIRLEQLLASHSIDLNSTPRPREREELILEEIRAARTLAVTKGYTPDHDDEHGLNHLVFEASNRIMPFPDGIPTRNDLIAAAALAVSAIAHLDRQNEEPDTEVGIGDE
jgi:hypothetical protein